MIGVLGHQHLGEQSSRGDALVDHLGGQRRLGEGLALGADPFAADVALHQEAPRGVVELLAHVLADALHFAAAAAHAALGLVADLDPRQVRGQGCAHGLVPGQVITLAGLQRLELLLDRFEVGADRLLEQARLHALQLLAAGSKAPALDQRHLVGQLLDLELPVPELVILARDLVDQLGGQSAQLLRIQSGKLIVNLHARDAATRRSRTEVPERIARFRACGWSRTRPDAARAIRSAGPAVAPS